MCGRHVRLPERSQTRFLFRHVHQPEDGPRPLRKLRPRHERLPHADRRHGQRHVLGRKMRADLLGDDAHPLRHCVRQLENRPQQLRGMRDGLPGGGQLLGRYMRLRHGADDVRGRLRECRERPNQLRRMQLQLRNSPGLRSGQMLVYRVDLGWHRLHEGRGGRRRVFQRAVFACDGEPRVRGRWRLRSRRLRQYVLPRHGGRSRDRLVCPDRTPWRPEQRIVHDGGGVHDWRGAAGMRDDLSERHGMRRTERLCERTRLLRHLRRTDVLCPIARRVRRVRMRRGVERLRGYHPHDGVRSAQSDHVVPGGPNVRSACDLGPSRILLPVMAALVEPSPRTRRGSPFSRRDTVTRAVPRNTVTG
jgi:hypothetical protein